MTVKELNDTEVLTLANLLMTLRKPIVLSFEYTNYRGEKSARRVIPEKAWHGSTKWHPEQCLLLTAYDIDKAAHRDFKFTDIDLTSMKAARL
jgi:predicted DNA-binding transcriptional regulator YafY